MQQGVTVLMREYNIRYAEGLSGTLDAALTPHTMYVTPGTKGKSPSWNGTGLDGFDDTIIILCGDSGATDFESGLEEPRSMLRLPPQVNRRDVVVIKPRPPSSSSSSKGIQCHGHKITQQIPEDSIRLLIFAMRRSVRAT